MRKTIVDPATMTAITAVLSLLLGGGCPLAMTGCGPSTPSITAAVEQVVNSQTASILSQVDWKQVMTQLKGSVGPETVIEAEGFIKQSAGMVIRVHGGNLSFDTQASGTGGKDNSEFMNVVVPILQRYENADNLNKQQRQKLTEEIVQALIRYYDAKAAREAAKTTPTVKDPSPPTTPETPAKTEPPQ